MDLRTKVVFHLTTEYVSERNTPNGLFVGMREYSTTIKNLDEFREFVCNFTAMVQSGKPYIDKGTYLITLKRSVIISDEDDRVNFKAVSFPDKEMRVILCTADKLLYVTDIDSLLHKQRPYFSYQSPKFADKTPIYFEYFDGHNVKYRKITQNKKINDIVIDKNLNQRYPLNTGALPIELVEFLAKITEPVR